jgi:nucleoside recognition membrane protein YjiH
VSWQETISVIIVLAGLGAGAFLVAQRPSFWIEFGVRIFKAILPTILKRMPPEEEAAWRKCMLRGGKWNHRKRRCE